MDARHQETSMSDTPCAPQAFNPVGWFEIYVADMARARRFYENVFQRTLSPLQAPPGDDVELTAFDMAMGAMGAAGALVKSRLKGPGDGGTMVYFSCQDCAAEQSRVVAAGGTVCQPKFSIGPYGFIAIVQDSEGNTIGLHSMA
jgi:predicted enzyme related to lactoylglutathione lyase